MISAYVALPDGKRACLVCLDTFWETEGSFILEVANDEHEVAARTGVWRIKSSDECGRALSLEDDETSPDPVDAEIVNQLLALLLTEHGAAWRFQAVETV
jgi:hypothetical protein